MHASLTSQSEMSRAMASVNAAARNSGHTGVGNGSALAGLVVISGMGDGRAVLSLGAGLTELAQSVHLVRRWAPLSFALSSKCEPIVDCQRTGPPNESSSGR